METLQDLGIPTRKGGRPPISQQTKEGIIRLWMLGKTYGEIKKELDVSRTSVWREVHSWLCNNSETVRKGIEIKTDSVSADAMATMTIEEDKVKEAIMA